MRIRRNIVLGLVATFLLANELGGQMRPSAFTRPASKTHISTSSAVPEQESALRGVLMEATPYVNWGIAIGAAAGAVYGLVSADDDERGLLALAYGVAGIAVGFVGGMLTFGLVKLGRALGG